MPKLKACGLSRTFFRYLEKRKKGLIKVRDLFFIIIIFSFFLADLFAAEEASLDLDPIIITKSNIHLASPYSLESDSLKPPLSHLGPRH